MTDSARRARWSALHHGIEPSAVPLLTGWLRGMWAVAGVLARWRVPPTAVTVAGVVVAVSAAITASRVPAVAAVLVVLAALCDGIDGAIAVVADRATAFGARADAVADRCCDIAFAVVLGRCGVPWALAIAAAFLAVGVDMLRRVLRLPAVITVAERPTFAVCAVLACGCAAVSESEWPVLVCAGVWLSACGVAVVHLLAAWRGAREPTPPGPVAP